MDGAHAMLICTGRQGVGGGLDLKCIIIVYIACYQMQGVLMMRLQRGNAANLNQSKVKHYFQEGAHGFSSHLYPIEVCGKQVET